MTYREAEDYLLSLSNLPRREYMADPARCQLYLDRTAFFLELLGSPEKKIPHYVHITGTSGKGSVATFFQSVLHAAGERTGLLTSPHASRLTERWQVNGKSMTDAEFIHIVRTIKPILDKYTRQSPYDMISFHEITDVIGFYYFAKKRVTWAVLEVGAGGRYCSSNVIPQKDVAIITNIGWDHVELLGPTKKKIAYEKAGIITSPCDVFTMEKRASLREIFKNEATHAGARLRYIPPTGYQVRESNIRGTTFVYKDKKYSIPVPGEHQIHNAILVIEAAEKIGLSAHAIAAGLKRAAQTLRMEVVSEKPLIILDGAHNQEKMDTTVRTVQKELAGQSRDLHLVIGFSGDKMVEAMIQQLLTLQPKTVACTRNTINLFRKVASPKHMADTIRASRPDTRSAIFLDPKDALAWSLTQTKKNDILLVTGSIFLSGEIRSILTKRLR